MNRWQSPKKRHARNTSGCLYGIVRQRKMLKYGNDEIAFSVYNGQKFDKSEDSSPA